MGKELMVLSVCETCGVHFRGTDQWRLEAAQEEYQGTPFLQERGPLALPKEPPLGQDVDSDRWLPEAERRWLIQVGRVGETEAARRR